MTMSDQERRALEMRLQAQSDIAIATAGYVRPTLPASEAVERAMVPMVDLDEAERDTRGFRGEFVYKPAWEADNGGPVVCNMVDFAAGLYYIPEGAEFDERYPEDDGCTLVSGADREVAEPMARILNRQPALLAELRAARERVAGLEADARAKAGDCCPDWKIARVHHIDCPMMMRDAYQRAHEANERTAISRSRIGALSAGMERAVYELRASANRPEAHNLAEDLRLIIDITAPTATPKEPTT